MTNVLQVEASSVTNGFVILVVMVTLAYTVARVQVP